MDTQRTDVIEHSNSDYTHFTILVLKEQFPVSQHRPDKLDT